jgi:hypothetical protein
MKLDRPLVAPVTRYELFIDGQMEQSATIRNVDGPLVQGNLVEEITGGSPLPIKHTTSREQQAINVDAAMSDTSKMWDWAKRAIAKEPARHSGHIIHADSHGKSVAIQEFHNALLEEITFPQLDAYSKELATLKFKLRPEYTTIKFDDSIKLDPRAPIQQRSWSCDAFRISFDHIDDECTGWVDRIDSWTFKFKIKPVACGSFMGTMSLPELEVVGATLPNIKFSTQLATAKPLIDWYNKMRNGAKDTSILQNGRIEFLDSSRNKVMGWLDMFEVGCNELSIAKSDAKGEEHKRVTFGIFVNRWGFGGNSGTDFWLPM